MRLFSVVSLVSALALSGCYTSDDDLVGSRATRILSASTLLNFDGHAYFFRAPSTLCTAEMSAAGGLECGTASQVAVERTPFGNYIVQLRRDGSPTYYYWLWFRDSDPLKDDCVVTLGKDVAGLGANSIVAGAALGSGQRVSTGVLPRELEVELVSRFPNAGITNRRALLDIVALYEGYFLMSRTCGEMGGSRLNYESGDLVIEGDRRHLPAYDPN